MAKKTYIFPMIAVLLMFTLIAIFGVQEYSIISASEVKVGDDGKPIWTIELSPTGSGETLLFIDRDRFEPHEDDDGGTYIPSKDIEIDFKPLENYCEYTLEEDQVAWDRFRSWFPLSREFTVYEMRSKEKNIPVEINAKGGTPSKNIVNMAESGTEVVVSGDDGGELFIETLGSMSGTSDCPDADRYVRVFEDGEYKFYHVSLRNNEDETWMERNEIQDVEFDFEEGVMKAYMSTDNLGLGRLLVTADAEYLDYRYYPPTMGQPEIVDIDMPEDVGVAQSSEMSVVVKNTGNDMATFKVSVDGDNAEISSPQQSNIEASEEKRFNFIITGGDSNEGSINVEACSPNPFGEDLCDSESVLFDITTEDVETYDKDQVIECDIPGEVVENGKCVCEYGYEYEYNDDDEKVRCVPVSEWDENLITLLIVLGFVAINIGVIGIYFYKKK